MTGIGDETFEQLGVYKLESVEKAILHFFLIVAMIFFQGLLPYTA